MAIVNGTFDVDTSGWDLTGNGNAIWESGKTRVHSNSVYGSSWEEFVYFKQRFLVEHSTLLFDVRSVSVGDTDYACGRAFSSPGSNFPVHLTCGYTIMDDSGNVIIHGVPGSVTETVSVYVGNYIGQYLTVMFIAGGATYNSSYFDIIVDNVKNVPGITFDPICIDTGEHCIADLYIDNIYIGKTPVDVMPKPGTHTILLLKLGYVKYINVMNVTPDMAGTKIEPILIIGMPGITNGAFDIDLSHWVTSGDVIWDNGKARLGSGSISHIFIAIDNLLVFDWEMSFKFGWIRWEIYKENVKVMERSFDYNTYSTDKGKEFIYLQNYIGDTLKLVITTGAWAGGRFLWLDNIIVTYFEGIFNGDFSSGLSGWDVDGSIEILTCNYPDNCPYCQGYIARLNSVSTLKQKFVVDKCRLKFDWCHPASYYRSYASYYSLFDEYGDLIVSGQFPTEGHHYGRMEFDVSEYIGKIIEIQFSCWNRHFYIDNITTEGLYSIDIRSHPSGARIYIDGIDTNINTIDTAHIRIDVPSEETYTITLKLDGFSDYIEEVNVARCVIPKIDAVFEGCIRIESNPSGAKIYIDGIGIGNTPNILCGYVTGESHKVILVLKGYKPEVSEITFEQGKGIFILKDLVQDIGEDTIPEADGCIYFISEPDGALVFVDNIYYGITPIIVCGLSLSLGTHDYRLELGNYHTIYGSVTLYVGDGKIIRNNLIQCEAWQCEPGTEYEIDGCGNRRLNRTCLPPQKLESLKDLIELFTAGLTGEGPNSYHRCCNGYASVVFYSELNGDVKFWGNENAWGCCGTDLSIYESNDPPLNPTDNDADYPNYELIFSRSYTNISDIQEDIFTKSKKYIRFRLHAAYDRQINIYKGDVTPTTLTSFVDRTLVPKGVSFRTYGYLKDQDEYGIHIYPIIIELYDKDLNLINIFSTSTDHDGNFSYTISTDNLEIGKYIIKIKIENTDIEDNHGINIHAGDTFVQKGCIYIDSYPENVCIFVNGILTNKKTPDIICGLDLEREYTYQLKIYGNTIYQGNFKLNPYYGEYIYPAMLGTIDFRSYPSGARIILDGNEIGTTPLILKNVKAGVHKYSLILDNFYEYECKVFVETNTTKIISPELTPIEGCLYINSCPQNASILINDIDTGLKTPSLICDLPDTYSYTLKEVPGYEDYTEPVNITGKGIYKNINLVRKIGVPFLDIDKHICSIQTEKIIYQNPRPYFPDPLYHNKDAILMNGYPSTLIIDCQGYSTIHLRIVFNTALIGSFPAESGSDVYIYQTDTLPECSSEIPEDAELLISTSYKSLWFMYNFAELFSGSLDIIKRYIIIRTYSYGCNDWECWANSIFSIYVMESLPPDCTRLITTCEDIIEFPDPCMTTLRLEECIIKRDEGIYPKSKYCYVGEGIFTKK